jgi:hypothetical protein
MRAMGVAAITLAWGMLANLAAFLGMRRLVATLCGARGGRFTVGLISRSRHLVAHRLLIAAAGPVGCYLVSGTLMALGTAAGGKFLPDEHSMRVRVAQDGPADEAGLRDGDRVVSVNGTPTPNWDELRRQVKAHPLEEIQVEVDRAGSRRVITATPGEEGRIGVAPPQEPVVCGLGDCIAEWLLGPARFIKAYLGELVDTLERRGPVVLEGPIATIRHAGPLSTPQVILFAGYVSASYLWIPVLWGLALLPWPRKDRTHEDTSRHGSSPSSG